MIVKLPESSKDITLYQYQKLVELLSRTDLSTTQLEDRKIHLFTGIRLNDIQNIVHSDREDMLVQIELALNEPSDFVNTFKIEDVEFGFITNFDKITSAEYFDLSKYGQEVETLHNLMAVLFRPIKQKAKLKLGAYSIEEYKGTEEWAEIMKLTPMNVVNGALFFFANLRNELMSCIQRYMTEEQKRGELQATISKSGDGTQPLMS